MSAPAIINLADAITRVTAEGVPVHGAPATGLPLHSNGHLGADILHVPAGKQFPVHTHPGDHLLYCLQGEGTISVDRITYQIRPGDFYMVDGLVPHAVGAGDCDHILVAIGAPHKPVQSPERMAFVDWDGNLVAEPLSADGTAVPATPRPSVPRSYEEFFSFLTRGPDPS